MNIIHALEQMRELLRDLAPVLWGYYNDLLKQGFTPEQAMELVVAYQQSLMKQNGDR